MYVTKTSLLGGVTLSGQDQGIEKRQQPRIQVNVVVQGDGSSSLPSMHSRDISTGGISIETAELVNDATIFAEGTAVNLTFSLPFKNEIHNVAAEIIWLRNHHPNIAGKPVTLFGVKFIQPDENLIRSIQDFLVPPPITDSLTDSYVQPRPVVENESPEVVGSTQQNVETDTTLFPVSMSTADYGNLCSKLLADASSANGSTEEHVLSLLRMLLPRERVVLTGAHEQDSVFRSACLLLIKLQADTKIWGDFSQKNPDKVFQQDIVQDFVDRYQVEVESVGDKSRQVVGTLYSQAKTEEGQFLTSLNNKVEGYFEQFKQQLAKLAAIDTSSASDRKFAGKPIRHYYDVIGSELRAQSAEMDNATVMGVELYPWEVSAFKSSTDYWNREERSVVLAAVALFVKLKTELAEIMALRQKRCLRC